MLFGFVAATIAGFLLTAIPNWTGRLPVRGGPLAGLFGLWATGRLAVALSGLTGPAIVAGLDLTFPLALCAVVWREILTGANWRNRPGAGRRARHDRDLPSGQPGRARAGPRTVRTANFLV